MHVVKNLQILVHAQYETVWNLLLERVRFPERHHSGVGEVRVEESGDDVILREFKLHGAPVKERITILPHEGKIRHELLEHPQFTGTITTRVVRTARQSPVTPQQLEYEIELVSRGLVVKGVLKGEAEIVADFQAEMNQIKSRAEETELRL